MTTNEYKPFAELWNSVRESYGKEPLSAVMMQLDFTALADWTLSDVMRGLALHRADREQGMFMPTPAHIVRQLEEGAESKARAAFVLARRAVREAGRYQSVQFEDAFLHYALGAVGGMDALCSVTEEERPHLERRFCQHYQDAVRREVTFDHPDVQAVWMGELARKNADAGYADGSHRAFRPEPVLRFGYGDGRPQSVPWDEALAIGSGGRPAVPALPAPAEGSLSLLIQSAAEALS